MFLQLLVCGLISGSLYAILGVSWGIIYSTTRIFHFAHGISFTLGAYLTIVLGLWLHIPMYIALPLALIGTAIFGCTIERQIYMPIREKGATQLAVFLSAMGVMVLGEALLHLIFTPTPRTLPAFSEELINIGPVYFTLVDFVMALTSWICIGCIQFVLSTTGLGRQIRAVRSNKDMAIVVGMNVEKIYLAVFAIGSALMALGGYFEAMRSAATPHMGLQPLLMGFIVVFLGGIGRIWGVALAGLAIGIGENLSLLYLPAQYKSIVVFAIMFIFVIYRPKGLTANARG